MFPRAGRLPLLLVLAALALPPATAQADAAAAPVHHVLYLHPLDALSDVPANTQPPPEGHAVNLGLSVGASSLSCIPGAPLGSSNDYHTTYAYPTPTLIDYDSSPPRVRPERGTGLELALGGDLVLHWFVTTDVMADAQGVATAFVIPNVVVQATLRAGNAISVDDQAYNGGEVIASGQAGPALLAGPLTDGATYSEVDGRPVYGFQVPLGLQADALPASGFNLRIDTYVLREECPQEGYIMPSAIAIHSSDGHRPRLEFDGSAPFRAAYFEPRIGDGRVTVRTAVTAAWGFYDVRDVELTIQGPSAAPTVFGFIFDPRVSGTPFGLTDPFSGTWTWDSEHDAAEPGDYHATFVITDQQGVQHTVGEAAFRLEPEQEAPWPSTALALAALASAVAWRRRR